LFFFKKGFHLQNLKGGEWENGVSNKSESK
jgi:hypothetical protein